MLVDAPGKLVLSGAYAVLRGAPAIVTAVDRRVVADSSCPSNFDSPEVRAARELLAASGPVGPAPWYDASDLRRDGDKLGLGSSAAICVACSATLYLEQRAALGESVDPGEVLGTHKARSEVFRLARQAHFRAQGGGSGIDVAASVFGGTFLATLPKSAEEGCLPTIEPNDLPRGLVLEVWALPSSASTAHFVRRFFASRERDPVFFDSTFGELHAASISAAHALKQSDASSLIASLRAQAEALSTLGTFAELSIVLPEVTALGRTLDSDSCFLPSGAGGGDVNIFLGPGPSNLEFRRKAKDLGLFPVPMKFGAEGVRLRRG